MMTSADCVLVLVCLQLTSVLCQPPIACVTSPGQPRGPQSLIGGRPGPGSVECRCTGDRRSYTGNLNFVKAALSQTRPRGGGNVDLVLRDCDLLRLELNFHNVAAQQPFNLRIYESDRVEINVVELSLSLLSQTRQTIVVKNVSSLHVEGRVQCRVCPEDIQEMLNIQMENVSRFVMTNSSVSLPLKLTGRHMQEVTIQDSTFTTLPWPGIFLHNASHVTIVRNFFLQTVPRSISISLGNLINVSHNLLDVSEALKIEQYEHQVIKCNRASPNIGLPATCNIPRLEFNTLEPEDDGVREMVNIEDTVVGVTASEDRGEDQQTSLEDDIRATIDREQDIIVTVLGTVDTLGLIWVLAALVIVSLFILCHLCRRCRSRTKQQKPKRRGGDNLKTAAELRPDLLVIPFPGDEEGDEYSESSRVHLAMGPASPGLPQWVTVQGVRAEPQEDGVVCGSLTLGPSFVNKDLDKGESDRTVSSNILKQQAFSKV